jgi:hypothetical protein
MNIEQRLQNIESMLKTLVEQTAPPPSIKTKAQIRERIRREESEFLERKKKREERKSL